MKRMQDWDESSTVISAAIRSSILEGLSRGIVNAATAR